MTSIDLNELTIVASGPLTSNKLSNEISRLLGNEPLYFYDAAAPLVLTSSINMDIAYKNLDMVKVEMIISIVLLLKNNLINFTLN